MGKGLYKPVGIVCDVTLELVYVVWCECHMDCMYNRNWIQEQSKCCIFCREVWCISMLLLQY